MPKKIKEQKGGKKQKKKMKKDTTKYKITKDMTFAEVISKYPQTEKIFFEYGMHCIHCPMASQETIETGAAGHGINLEKLIDALNKSIKKK